MSTLERWAKKRGNDRKAFNNAMKSKGKELDQQRTYQREQKAAAP